MTACTRSTSRTGVNAASFSGFTAFFYSVEYALNMDKAEKHATSADISNRATYKPLMAYAKAESSECVRARRTGAAALESPVRASYITRMRQYQTALKGLALPRVSHSGEIALAGSRRQRQSFSRTLLSQ